MMIRIILLFSLPYFVVSSSEGKLLIILNLKTNFDILQHPKLSLSAPSTLMFLVQNSNSFATFHVVVNLKQFDLIGTEIISQ